MEDVSLPRDKLAEGDLSVDVLCSLLTHIRRRATIRHLRESDGPVRMSDLAFAVAASVMDTPNSQVPMETARCVRNSLYHVHLPKLEASNVVDFDQDQNTVEASENLPEMVSVLDCAIDGC